MSDMIKRAGRWVRKEKPKEYEITTDHFTLARKLDVDHGEAVLLARTFCPSGHWAGDHGRLCPCNSCTVRAVVLLNAGKKESL